MKWIFADITETPRFQLDNEVSNAGLTYRHPSMPKDGNCLFHAMSDQLTRLGMSTQNASELRADLVDYLRNNPATPDGTHFRYFIYHGGWESYLRRIAKDGEWGDWIALWGLVNHISWRI